MNEIDFFTQAMNDPEAAGWTFHSSYHLVETPASDESYGQQASANRVGHLNQLGSLTMLKLVNDYPENSVRTVESEDGTEIILFVRTDGIPKDTTEIAS